MPAPINYRLLQQRDKNFTNMILRTYGSHGDVFTMMAPTITNNHSPEMTPNARVTCHIPGDPRVKVDENISYAEIKDLMDAGNAAGAEQHLANRAEKFIKLFRMRTKRGKQVEANRKAAEGE